MTVMHTTDYSLGLVIPSYRLLNESLVLGTSDKQFKDWSAQNHADSYHFMRRIAQVWKNSNFTQQYLIFGKIDANVFKWEMVPYQKCRTFIGRVIQQLQVLWRIAFGGLENSVESKQDQRKKYQQLLKNALPDVQSSNTPSKGDDSFCKNDTIERQWVITGNKVHVLFNYAPIGFGGERLHFLVVPKEHRETFTDVTQEEYCESMELTTKLVEHFDKTRNTKNVYLFNKTGVDAGQSVKHWHLHVIFSSNPAQDFWGKMTVVKNILFGSSPMKKEELARNVSSLRQELASIKV
jgi:diadenosine tetraphosphate (Ap4A) HIT family hydrolase